MLSGFPARSYAWRSRPPSAHDIRLDLVLPPLPSELAGHGGDYSCDVMGDSQCQPALRQIFRKRMAAKPAAWVPYVSAQLLPDPAQSSRVQVLLDGHVVGYLGKVNTREYLALSDRPASVPACLRWDGQRYSIRLSLALR